MATIELIPNVDLSDKSTIVDICRIVKAHLIETLKCPAEHMTMSLTKHKRIKIEAPKKYIRKFERQLPNIVQMYEE